MHTSADPPRQIGVGADQQNQPARAANNRQFARRGEPIYRAEMPINDCSSAREAPRHRNRIGRPFRIGEKIKCWYRRYTHPAIEPARVRR